MSRPTKGARLWLRPEEHDERGALRKRSVWVIRGGARKISTGCAAGDRSGAEQALAAYIASKYQVPRDRSRRPSEILIADVLNIYLTDVAPGQMRAQETRQRALRLAEWWGEKTLADVNGRTCREYTLWRTSQPIRSAKPGISKAANRKASPAAPRRELEDLRAAINYHRKEGLCSEVIEVTLPPKPPARERWMTRSEVARLLWAAWRYRESQKGVETKKNSRRHVVRFILVALYTGTRSAAICAAGFAPEQGRSWVDLEWGVFYRRAVGARETNKRQPPVRLPKRLLAHIRRWREMDIAQNAVVEFNGQPVSSIKKAFANCVKDAGLDASVTPHILRHTCATWMMQNGVDLWEAASFLGMTVQQLEATYGHHHADFQVSAAEAVTAKKAR